MNVEIWNDPRGHKTLKIQTTWSSWVEGSWRQVRTGPYYMIAIAWKDEKEIKEKKNSTPGTPR